MTYKYDELQPAIGEIVGKRHLMPIRVYWEDTDASGIVYHANHVKYMERARTEFLRQIGIEQSRLLRDVHTPIKFAVTSLAIDYFQPAYLDDFLTVETEIEDIKGASVIIVQIIKRRDMKIAAGHSQVATLNIKGTPTRIPKQLLEIFNKLK